MISFMPTRREKHLEEIAAYLDRSNPLVRSAAGAYELVKDAPDQAKLSAFNYALHELRSKVAEWVGAGYELYRGEIRDSEEALDHLRIFLAARFGQQLSAVPKNVSDDPLVGDSVAVWYWPTQPANKFLVWWVAEASAGEGYQLMAMPDPEPDDEMAAPQLPADIDADLARQWKPPSWLWRTPDMDSGRPAALQMIHSDETAARELAYIHWHVWEDIEEAIVTVRLRRDLTSTSRKIKRRPKADDVKQRERIIREAIAAGDKGLHFCETLDDEGVKPLPEWTNWPGSWVAAYKGMFKKKIQDLKNRHATKLGNTRKRQRL